MDNVRERARTGKGPGEVHREKTGNFRYFVMGYKREECSSSAQSGPRISESL
jgi:hypothetical protein